MIKELCIALYQLSGGGYAHAMGLRRKHKKMERICASMILVFDGIKELCMALYQRSGVSYAHAIRLQREGQNSI